MPSGSSFRTHWWSANSALAPTFWLSIAACWCHDTDSTCWTSNYTRNHISSWGNPASHGSMNTISRAAKSPRFSASMYLSFRLANAWFQRAHPSRLWHAHLWTQTHWLSSLSWWVRSAPVPITSSTCLPSGCQFNSSSTLLSISSVESFPGSAFIFPGITVLSSIHSCTVSIGDSIETVLATCFPSLHPTSHAVYLGTFEIIVGFALTAVCTFITVAYICHLSP